jgi:uncharacterized protein (DUF1330 family)
MSFAKSQQQQKQKQLSSSSQHQSSIFHATNHSAIPFSHPTAYLFAIMGAAASTIPDKLDLAAVKALTLDKFDQSRFDAMKDVEGFVGKDMLMKAKSMASNKAYLIAFTKGKADNNASAQIALDPFEGKIEAINELAELPEKATERTTAADFNLVTVLSFPNEEKALQYKNSDAYQKSTKLTQGPVCISAGLSNESMVGGNGTIGALLPLFVKITDPAAFSTYASQVQATLEGKGQFLVRAPLNSSTSSPLPVVYTGRTTATDYDLSVLLGFPTLQIANDWFYGEEYQTIIGARLESSHGPLAICPALQTTTAAVSAVKEIPLTELKEAIKEAHAAGLTPLVSDRSANHLVDTYFSYSAGALLDAKKVSLELAKKNTTQEFAQEECRKFLVLAMKRGYDLVVACQQASPSFSTTLCNGTTFPKEIFKAGGMNQEWANKIMTEEDTGDTGGVKIFNPEFTVVVTSHFSVEDLDDFFFGEGFGFADFPKTDFQIISIKHEDGEEMLD